jgi:hypothetical protein
VKPKHFSILYALIPVLAVFATFGHGFGEARIRWHPWHLWLWISSSLKDCGIYLDM